MKVFICCVKNVESMDIVLRAGPATIKKQGNSDGTQVETTVEAASIAKDRMQMQDANASRDVWKVVEKPSRLRKMKDWKDGFPVKEHRGSRFGMLAEVDEQNPEAIRAKVVLDPIVQRKEGGSPLSRRTNTVRSQ